MTDNNHTSGHRDRLRQRFLKTGIEGMPDYEILELLLMQSIPRKDVKPIAKDLIFTFKTLPRVLSADMKDLTKVNGIGETAAFNLKLALAIAQSYRQNIVMEKPSLNNQLDLIDYLYSKMEGLLHEEFHVIYLDSKHHIIHDECLFKGTVNSTAAYPREVVKAALKHGAVNLILTHNHPSGDPAPSREDEALTMEIQVAAHALDIKLIDHIIIGDGHHYSFSDHCKI